MVIIRALCDALDVDEPQWGQFNRTCIDLIIVGFFWLLRPAEYLESSTPGGRSQAFRFQDLHLTIGNRIYNAPLAPLNDPNVVNQITFSAFLFGDQKNAVRGEQIGHQPSGDPFFCPCRAAGRIAHHLYIHGAPADTPVYRHFNPADTQWYSIKPKHITNALRHAADLVKDTTGIDKFWLSARSLRPGGATALLCASVDTDIIALLGRWRSDAMLRYLRAQAASIAHSFSRRMLQAGDYTFAPGCSATGGPPPLPVNLPEPVAAVLQHHELYLEDSGP